MYKCILNLPFEDRIMDVTEKHKEKKPLSTELTVIVILALIALGVTMYPLISNRLAERNRSLVETSYEETVKQLDETEKTRLLSEAEHYNQRLLESSYPQYSLDAINEAKDGYEDLLNPRGDGIMGYIQIPKISVALPLYHGTEEAALEKGVGHVLGSSLPIGGDGTHSILSGHSGLAGQKMFTDIDKLLVGDIFYLKILNEVLAYQVTEINTVLPEDVSLLAAIPGRDRCTLVTCTPYGVNSHRLLVQGDRIDYEEAVTIAEETVQATGTGSTWTTMYLRGILYGLLAMVLVFGIAALLYRPRKRTKNHAEEQ